MCEGKLGGRCTETSAKTLPAPTEFALTTSVIPLLLGTFNAPLAQLDRASDYGSEGWGFDSLKARHGNDCAGRCGWHHGLRYIRCGFLQKDEGGVFFGHNGGMFVCWRRVAV